MHQSAMHYGRRFFEVYVQRLPATPIKLVEIGSLNVNGSLRDVCPTGIDYVGLDFSAGQGVDIVIEDPYKLPLTDDSVDVVVTSSCFEHSEFFWLVFLEAMRILKPGGVLYLNVPSNGFFHRWPVDCWRFYPDSGQALVRWAKRNGYDALLLESFIGERSAGRVSEGGMWNDFVAVVLKSASQRDRYPHRIIDALDSFSNGFSSNREGILNLDERGPDFSLIDAQHDRIDKFAREVETLRLEKTELASGTVERDRQIEATVRTITERDETIAALHGVMAERDRHLEAFARTITERDGMIAALHGVMAERDRYLEAFARTITERDGTIAGGHGTVAECDRQIKELSQTIAERDRQIEALSQTIAECDRQIKELSQTIAECDRQIKELSQTIAERDRQIEALSQTIAERDETVAALRGEVTDRDRQVEASAQQLGEHEATIANLRSTLTSRDHEIAELIAETVRRGEWAIGLHVELQQAHAQLNTVVHTNSWRMTLPLRETRRWISTPVHQFKRYARASLRLAKRAYQALPIDYQTKAAHRSFLAHRFPKMLLASGSHPASIPVLPMPLTRSPEARGEVPSAEQVLAGATIDLTLTTSANPKVSVIVPIYGKLDYTLRCLASIAGNLPVTSFEIIVIDDCSPDHSFETLSGVGGIRLIRNRENQGFIRSCNAGAEAARGEFLYFLNNDTEVTPGWLDELVRTFDEFPGTGLAGSKLIYPDGRLQEAGGIIWKDGSAWNFGRFQDPMLPVYNYAREVDYCSGASVMVPRNLFAELGGFDERYLPAYCEDSDLALKIRDRGHRVIYQPLSTVIHYEGITSGNDTSQGVKAYQIDNTRKLFERWRDRLQAHQEPGVDPDAAKDRRATRRALVIDHCTPTPDQDAGSVTVFNLLLLLREMDFQVTFIPEDNFLYMPEYTTRLQRAGIEVLYAPSFTNVPQHLAEVGKRYQLALLFRPAVVERHLNTVRRFCPNAKVLFHTVDLHFLRMEREAILHGDSLKQRAASEMKERELAAINAVDSSIVHSTAELEILAPLAPDARISVFPLIMDAPGPSAPFAARRDILFVGGFQHAPNVDAVHYFATEVMPLVRLSIPGIAFHVVGSKTPPEIERLACSDILIRGYVEDLTPVLDEARVSVAPLRYGAGIKGKIGTAMAAGLPVVATTVAVEGMSLHNGENILVADSPEEFTTAIERLYTDEILWNKISSNGWSFAEKTWGGEAAWRILAGILNDLSISSTRGTRPLSLYSPRHTEATHKVAGIASPSNGPDESYQKKIQQELAIYEKQTNVHDLPEIFHYWSNKHLVPLFRDAGFTSFVEFFAINLLEASKRTNSGSTRFVSIGSGNCDLEVSVAIKLIEAGCNDFILDCVEINPAMLDRGRMIARDRGILGRLQFIQADFNTWVPTTKYDGVMANQSLHHVTELEHLFEQIMAHLATNGSFVISDMIGRNGHQRWPESLAIVNKFWKELPEAYKHNVLLNRLETEYENWDCSKEGFEGIRSQDILPLLIERFNCEKFVGYGSAIDVFVDRCFGHNFNPAFEWDRDVIDRVHAEDEAGLANHTLTPTHMIGVFTKSPCQKPYYARGVNPRAAIRDPKK